MDSMTSRVNKRAELVRLPLDVPEKQTMFGNVGSVEYRDTLDGVRYTAHLERNWVGWVVRHDNPTGDSDGPAVARSHLVWGMDALNELWERVRGAVEPGDGPYDPDEGQWGQGPNPLDPADGHPFTRPTVKPTYTSSGCRLCGQGVERHRAAELPGDRKYVQGGDAERA